MEIPLQVPVMTLPQATLFPQALLPLFIFEPRYRAMLADALRTERMFAVAMQQTEASRETPCAVAGVGVIRVSVDHEDGTSHLILQGLARVQLLEPVQRKPYRVHAVRPLDPPPAPTDALAPLVSQVHALVRQRFDQGAFPFPLPLGPKGPAAKPNPCGADNAVPAQDIIGYLKRLPQPAELADLVACALLSDPAQRQTILETVALEDRLQRLIHFLMAEIQRCPKNPSP